MKETLQKLTEQAQELHEAVAGLNSSMTNTVTGLAEVVQKDRRKMSWLAISVGLDVLLSFGLGVVALETRQAQHSAEVSRSNAVLTCEVSNQTRAAQVQLWTYILTLSDQKPTPEQAEKVRKFKIYLTQVFAPRDCSDLSKVNPPPTPPS